MNYLRTAILLAALTALFMGVGYLLAGTTGMTIAFLAALAMNAYSYWNSDKVVLRMYNAHEVGPHQAPELYTIVQELAGRAGLPMPKVYLIDNPQPNAFATGRSPDHAAVAATSGLLNLMSREEIAAVMAHELAHVQNRDTLTMTITATLAGAISLLANFGMFFGGGRDRPGGFLGTLALIFLAPLAAGLVQMAISRNREYAADRLGAAFCGNPLWLASALRRLEAGVHSIPNAEAERNPASAHLFIVNPLSGARMDNLFSTHPATANRVRALEELARHMPPAGGSFLPSGFRGPWGDAPRSPRRGPWG